MKSNFIKKLSWIYGLIFYNGGLPITAIFMLFLITFLSVLYMLWCIIDPFYLVTFPIYFFLILMFIRAIRLLNEIESKTDLSSLIDWDTYVRWYEDKEVNDLLREEIKKLRKDNAKLLLQKNVNVL